MSTENAQVVFAILAYLAAGLAVVTVIAFVTRNALDASRRFIAVLSPWAVWIAWAIAATATVGSLYFSEYANFFPCRLCWFQRIAMYPMAAVLLIGAFRRERAVWWYVLPMAIIGGGVSIYHSLIEWKPWIETTSCTDGISCTDIWFRQYGMTLAVMALCGFAAILALSLVGLNKSQTQEHLS